MKALGGDGDARPTEPHAPTRREIGIYWAYDGTPSLCAPPRLYNQIAVHDRDADAAPSAIELARLLALVNMAMADAGIAIWESKYFYELWRPIPGIRESDPGTGPTGLGDGNAATLGDPTSRPLGAPASNPQRAELHAAVPGLPVGPRQLRRRAVPDRCATSTARTTSRSPSSPTSSTASRVDNDGNVRDRCCRARFDSLSQAEEENGQSRIYLGIHWAFDKTEGIAQGRRVANYVYRNAFQPVNR